VIEEKAPSQKNILKAPKVVTGGRYLRLFEIGWEEP